MDSIIQTLNEFEDLIEEATGRDVIIECSSTGVIDISYVEYRPDEYDTISYRNKIYMR